jgi:peptidoglycan/LPS O-acetylase OafA/YrhL
MTSFSQHRFHVLDGMRGLAAILVMLHHYYFTKSAAPTAWASAHLREAFLGVDFFFILSGFVICHSYGEKLLSGMSPGDYLARRFARLFPMMAIGLLLGLLAFYVSGHANYTSRDLLIATIGNLFFIPFLGVRGPLFPTDDPLWSIFFELLASVAFIGLIRIKRRTLIRICAVSLGLLVIASFVACIEDGESWLHLSLGGGTHFFGGFPRVFFGFTCGMLLYQLRSMPSPFSLLNRIQSAPSFHPFILYAALVGMLLFPHPIKGLYSFGAIMVLAPLFVIQGSNAKCENSAVVATSKFLGWLSYPIYCLHVPILLGVRVIGNHVSFSAKYGVSCEAMAIVGTIFLATGSAFLFDRLKVQRNLAGFLRRIFEGGLWHWARVEDVYQ